MGAFSIPLQAKAPEINSPLQTIGGLMQLRGQMADMALRQQQIKASEAAQAENEAQTAQKRADLADQNTISELLRNPEHSAKIHTGDFSSLEGRVQPNSLAAYRKNQGEAEKDRQANTKEANINRASALGEISTTLAGLKQMIGDDGKIDVAKINSILPETISRLKGLGILDNAGIKTAPTSITRPEDLDTWAASIGGEQALLEKVLGIQELDSKAKKSTADAALAGTNAAKGARTLESDVAKAGADSGKAITDAAQAAKILAGTSATGITAEQDAQNAATTAQRTEQARHNRADEAIQADKAAKAAAPKSVPAMIVKGIAANAQTLRTIDEALDEIKKNPDAVGFKGYAPDTILNRVDPAGTTARALISRVAAQEFHDFSGAAVTVSEAARLKPFLPSIHDDPETVRTKLNGLRKQIQGLTDAQREAYKEGYQPLPGESPSATSSSASKFKAGDSRVKDGVTYIRNEKGEWHAQ